MFVDIIVVSWLHTMCVLGQFVTIDGVMNVMKQDFGFIQLRDFKYMRKISNISLWLHIGSLKWWAVQEMIHVVVIHDSVDIAPESVVTYTCEVSMWTISLWEVMNLDMVLDKIQGGLKYD